MRRTLKHFAPFGPIGADHGYPLWFQDSEGSRVELELELNEDVELRPYFVAKSDVAIPVIDGSCRATFSVVGAISADRGVSGIPSQEPAFGTICIQLSGGTPGGHYVFTHPYGTTPELAADHKGAIELIEEYDVSVPLPFLRWTSGADRLPGELETPEGYLGDGTTPHSVYGSPFETNYFAVEGPGIPHSGADQAHAINSLFTVQGKLATRVGVEISRAVYAREKGQVVVDVFAESEPDQYLQFSAARLASTSLSGLGSDYFARIATGSAVPARVTVHNLSDSPPTSHSARLVDALVVTSCLYDTESRTLSVDAASSDYDVPPALTVHGFGLLTNGSAVFSDVSSPPAHIVVTSSAGGSTACDVLVSGPARSVHTNVINLEDPTQADFDSHFVDLREPAYSKQS